MISFITGNLAGSFDAKYFLEYGSTCGANPRTNVCWATSEDRKERSVFKKGNKDEWIFSRLTNQGTEVGWASLNKTIRMHM